MSEKRDRMQIIHDILASIQKRGGKIKPTHLLYKSNLSYQRMNLYLDELIKKGLVAKDFDETGKFYVLTDKGYTFLAEFQKINEFTKSFGL
ncbi:MAG: winged helix-turn-helix domain-containing protein [Candidatus Woesearchaeota archaeon]